MRVTGAILLTVLALLAIVYSFGERTSNLSLAAQTTATKTPFGSEEDEIPEVIIVEPEIGASFRPGQVIKIRSQSFDRRGIARLELLVDNCIIGTDEFVSQSNTTLDTQQIWLPDRPGIYSLRVRAYTPGNVMGESAAVVIEVEEGATETPTPTFTPALPTATPTPSFPYLVITTRPGLNVRAGPSTRYPQIGLLQPGETARILGQSNIGAGNWWQIGFNSTTGNTGWVSADPDYSAAYNIATVPIITPPPTPVPPTPTLTPTPVAQTKIEFRADRTKLRSGECVTIFWNAENVREVYYEDEGVPGNNQSRVECPRSTTTYTLRVVKLDGTHETRAIKIEVEEPPFRVIEMIPDEGIDFDRDAHVSDDGDDFRWYEAEGNRRFGKWDDDDDLELVPVGPVNLDQIRREDCEWAIDNLDDQDSIRPFPGLAACIRTDDGRLGKIRFDNTDEVVRIQWALW